MKNWEKCHPNKWMDIFIRVIERFIARNTCCSLILAKMGGNWKEMFPTPLMCIITKSVRSEEEDTHVDEF